MQHGALAAIGVALVMLACVPAPAAASVRGLLQAPPAGSAAPADAGSATNPAAAPIYFPLLASNLTSAFAPPGVGPFTGAGQGVTWEADSQFGQVLTCAQERQAYVQIPGLQYGQEGGFGLAIWAKLRPSGNMSMDYILSHTGRFVTDYAFDPNEIALYVPEQNHPAFGVVRAIVRDSTDATTNGTDIPMYLDSNGCVADPLCAAPTNRSLFSPEGSWHLLGLGTHPEGGKGFHLYVDGQLVAAVAEGQTYRDAEGYTKTATGGGPMNLTGNLTLCARSDLEPSRFFTGSLAHLFVWNRSVTPEEMALIYEDGPQPQPSNASLAVDPTPGSAAVAGDEAEEPPKECTTPCQDDGGGLLTCRTSTGRVVVCPGSTLAPAVEAAGGGGGAAAATRAPDCATDCQDVQGYPVCFTADNQPRGCQPLPGASPAPAKAPTPAAAMPAAATPAPAPEKAAAPAPAPGGSAALGAAQLDGHPLCSAAPLKGIVTLQNCSQGYACAPLSRQQLDVHFGASLPLAVGDIGACVYAPAGVMLPNATIVPPAMAFFPLSSQTLESFPLPDYSAISSSSSVGIVADPLFGSVLQCSESNADMVGLSPVQYARSGAFSVNLWFRPGDMSGDTMAYLFSHRGTNRDSTATSNTGWGPNQVQIFLPREGHPAYGVVRAVVKDFNDSTTVTFLDSDGSISYGDGPRSVPANQSLFTGAWHMVTVTSQPGIPGAVKGYRLYVDGRLVNQLSAGTSYYTPEGLSIPVDGGDPILLDGNPVLCARSDDPSGRHYDGQLAYLSLFDSALDEGQVQELYETVAATMMWKVVAPTTAAAPGSELPIVPTQQSGPNATRFGVSGQQCQFPALWSGEVVNDCVNISGTLMCQVAESEWEACILDNPPLAAPPGPEAPRQTTDGAQCVFPATYAGQTITACTALDPGGPEMCRTATGRWAECAPATLSAPPPPRMDDVTAQSGSAGNNTGASSRAPITSTTHSTQCMLPLTYRGMQVDSCVSIAGSYLCWGQDTDAWEGCPQDVALKQPEPAELGLTAAAVSLPVVPTTLRMTTKGEACVLPVVVEGEILDDCVRRDGNWSCLNSKGIWSACDLRGSQPPVEEPGQVVVAQRYSLSGVPCRFPAVFNGFLFFDCVQAAAYNGSRIEGCPTQNAEWDVCADQSSNFTAPTLFNATQALNRTGPGPEGSLCSIVPSLFSLNANCAANLTCVPLPELALNASANGLEGLGFCVEKPVGGTKGIFPYLQARHAEPLAFFPLTANSTASLLLPTYNGSLSGAPMPGWVPDPVFDSVVNCSRAAHDASMLDTVPYAASGPFAVNLWMRRLPGANVNGTYYSYLYSHTGATISPAGQSPNQVAIYLPNAGHPAFGVVRAIVADASDSGPDLFYLDSDGTVGSDLTQEGRPRTPLHAGKGRYVNDGRWHMITLSTLPSGTKGYALYIDGDLAGQLGPGSATTDGSPVDATGGGPANLTDTIYLCSRSDSDYQRFFDGSVAHLLLFDRALTAQNVAGLYKAYSVNNTGEPAATAASGPAVDPQSATAPSSGGKGLSTSEITGIVLASLGGFIALLSLGALAVGHYRRQTRGKRFERFDDSAAAAAGAGAAGAALPPQLSIQLSNGKSLSLGSAHDALPNYQSALSDVSTQAASSTASGVPRMPTAHSGMPLLPVSNSGVGGPPPPYRRTASAPTRPSVAIPPAGSPFASAAPSAAGGEGDSEGTPSMVTAGSNPASTGSGVTVEPGRRGMFRSSGARVVLPGPPADGDPRSPYEP
ncbi:hypothetical protein ABPG75_006149 [Micractinium tetrahymenae]